MTTLPNDVIKYIMQFLSGSTLMNYMNTCKLCSAYVVPNTLTIDDAARLGLLKTVKHLYSIGEMYTAYTMDCAILSNNLKVIQYLRGIGAVSTPCYPEIIRYLRCLRVPEKDLEERANKYIRDQDMYFMY
jgi:hypothetical protein